MRRKALPTNPSPRLRSAPTDRPFDAATASLHAISAVWTLLSGHGRERLMSEGWRALGLGLVHIADPAFDVLAGAAATAWATLDARDGWNQTIADIARRQSGWLSAEERGVLRALRSATPQLYEIESHRAPRVVLRRVTDGTPIELHAWLDDGAYPPGTLTVCRVVRHDGLAVSLCSTVVSRHEAAELVCNGRVAPYRLNELSLRGAVRAIDEARAETTEAVWAHLGPASMRRVTRAAAAFRVAFSRAGSLMFRHVDSDGRHLFAEPARSGCRLTVETVASRRRLNMPIRLLPETTATRIAEAYQAQVVHVAMDADGLVPSLLREALEACKRNGQRDGDAIRVRHDPLGQVFQLMPIHFGHDQRHLWVHPPGGGVVDNNGSDLGELWSPFQGRATAG